MIRKKCILFFILLILYQVKAQNRQLLYNFREIPQSVMVNPGVEIHQKAYAGIPFMSGIYANAGSSGFTMHDLFSDDGVNFNVKVNRILYDLNDKDIIDVSEQIEILFGGYRSKKDRDNFYSFGVYQELDFYNYWPNDIARIAYEGNAGQLYRKYDLGDLNAQGEIITAVHFGVNRKVNKSLTVGVRGKIYNSMINITASRNSGTFVTVPGEDNVYRHMINADMEVHTSGYASLWDKNITGIRDFFKSIFWRGFFSGNLGLGMDLGFTYSPNDYWTYTGSLQDLGMMFHITDLESYTLRGAYALEGIEFLFGQATDDEFLNNYWDDLKDDLEEQIPLDTIKTVYTSFRPAKLNAAVIHNFGNLRYRKNYDCGCDVDDSGFENSVGLQLFAIHRPHRINAALTAFYYRRIFNFLRAKVTYTLDKYSYNNVGLGISTHFANINFYLLADNILTYGNLAKSNQASVQFGFNYIFEDKR
ncbi:DUF5723 family protein [Robertkochia solimangrovi]|uniref:DUF5723 family protein n=1 Tax=Robertkochia solimangrovi TaxID=2213046 RepID=UPI00117FEF66|nr:DUF5723 family protein [Robertkochia solimangrovi]TRZ44246.1 hypothetical protein DMZ48_06955 [Robertkochia solimangrovi]